MKDSTSIPAAPLFSPITYAWKRGEEWLYVGGTKRGIGRFSHGIHQVINKLEPVQPDDVIEIWTAGSKAEAHEFERELILKFKPKYNQYVGIGLSAEAGRGPGRKVQREYGKKQVKSTKEPIEEIEWECLRCGHFWKSRKFTRRGESEPVKPHCCARCRSSYWNKEPTNCGVCASHVRNHAEGCPMDKSKKVKH